MDLYANGQLNVIATSTSGTTAPAAGVVETWSVSALPSNFPTLTSGQIVRLIDPLQPTEIVAVVSMAPAGTSIVVVRGVEGTTPVAHATGAVFNAFLWTNAGAAGMSGGQLIDSATSYIGTVAGNQGTSTYNVVTGVGVIVPPGVPFSLDLSMAFGWMPGNAAVGTGLHFFTQIRNAAGVSVSQLAPYGLGGLTNNYADEYYVVPVVGHNQFRTHYEHWEMAPLAAQDVFTVNISASISGTSVAQTMPALGVGGPCVLTARRSG